MAKRIKPLMHRLIVPCPTPFCAFASLTRTSPSPVPASLFSPLPWTQPAQISFRDDKDGILRYAERRLFQGSDTCLFVAANGRRGNNFENVRLILVGISYLCSTMSIFPNIFSPCFTHNKTIIFAFPTELCRPIIYQ